MNCVDHRGRTAPPASVRIVIRGGSPNPLRRSRSRAAGRDTAAADKTPVAAKPAPRPAAPPRTVAATKVPVVTKPIAAPKLFATDGGTPLPSAGFLGFDSRSTPN